MEHKRSGMPFKMLVMIDECVKEIFIDMKSDLTGFSLGDEHSLETDQCFHWTTFVSSVGQVELRYLFAIAIAGVFNGKGKGKVIWIVLAVIIHERGVTQTITERIERFFRHETIGAVFHFVAVEGR